MTFRTGSRVAGALLALFAMSTGAPVLAQTADCTGGGRISQGIAKQMAAAQDAMKAKQWEKSLEGLIEAEAQPGTKSEFDKFHISEMRGYIYNNVRRDADAVRELESAYKSPCMPDAKKAERQRQLVVAYTALHEYPKAIALGESALAAPKDRKLLVVVARAYFRAEQYPEAARKMEEAITADRKPEEDDLQLLMASCQRLENQLCMDHTFEKLVELYPKPEYMSGLDGPPREPRTDEDYFEPLFNGKDLEGWTPKIAKHPVGENYADTFRVEDGVIKVSYDKYGKFDRQFGHLFTNQAYSNYILRLDYRFVGTAIEDSPPWAKLNSGVMIHAESPLSMPSNEEFPASMEFQFLATGATAGKQTGNVCTPGTNLEMGGKLLLDHIIDAKSKFYPLDEWVSVEAEVHGNKEVIYRVNGTEVLRYQHPQLDPRDPYAKKLLAAGAPMQLSFGHIALQAESQPVWFRNIRIKQLDE